jgi:hypothetical protein
MGSNGIGLWPELMFRSSSSSSPSVLRLRWVGWGGCGWVGLGGVGAGLGGLPWAVGLVPVALGGWGAGFVWWWGGLCVVVGQAGIGDSLTFDDGVAFGKNRDDFQCSESAQCPQ